MSDPLDRILEVATAAGRAAATVCRGVLAEAPASPDAMAKLGKEPVTVADYGSQAVILRAIAAAFPDHGVIAEEGAEHLRANAGEAGSEQIVRLVRAATGDDGADFDRVCAWIDHTGPAEAEYTWAIDPIDGTKGFLRRDQYAVAIGLLRAGRPYAGVLACPNLPVDLDAPDGPRGVLFVAAEGRGCTRVPLDGGAPAPARVTPDATLAAARVLGSVESAHGDPALVTAAIERLGIGGGFVRYDSQVKYGVVAQGGAEIYVRPRSRPDYRENIWDHAAGVVVCREAGGRVTDLDGRELDFSRGKKLTENRGVLATAGGELHDAVVAGIAAVEAAAG
ncbi:MAG: 3'(2'),5'-bisphosphate nucleotidase [Planctomycetota bacterium]|nr:MAG: 3'(2'),5'-bisphosphate nucleotidase [Planctomycetota bacterium]